MMRFEKEARADFLQAEPRVIAAWREPFSLGPPVVREWTPGASIADIVLAMPGLPVGFASRGDVQINGVSVPRAMWRQVRPKPTLLERPVCVTLHVPLQGGRGGGGKQVLALVAAVALTVATAGIGSGSLGLALGIAAIGPGTLGASILAAGVGLAGALAIGALTAPPAVKSGESGDSADSQEAASAEGNLLSPGGAIPRVIGTRKVFPPLACEPFIELDGEDEYVEAVYCLAGPHELTDIRIADAAAESSGDIEIETREGWRDDAALGVVTRQGRTTAPQIEISAPAVQQADKAALENQSNPLASLPVWHGAASRAAPDEIWLHLALPEGLFTTTDAARQVSVPFRIRICKRGDVSWINLPEIHYSSNQVRQIKVAVLLKWAAWPESLPGLGTSNGFVAAFKTVAAQSPDPSGLGGWAAHSHFSSGSGGDGYYSGGEGASKIQNFTMDANKVEVFLDAATFPQGIYDVEIKRGAPYLTTDFVASAYTHSGAVRDFFGYYLSSSTARIPLSRDQVSDKLFLLRVVSIWNEHPIARAGLALIGVRARNRRIERVSAIASGYVQDWDGAGWNSWMTTSNPAAHYRDVLSGSLNLDPLPASLRDDDGLVAWRTRCAADGLTCDMLADGQRVEDVLNILASCGYARPYQSEIWGVTEDYDRSNDYPVQVFSPRNAANFRWRKAFGRLPDGFRVTYRSDDADYAAEQLIVYRPGYSGGEGGRLEQVTYEGVMTAAQAQARALFDLKQGLYRTCFYVLEAPAEAIVCRRGSLVAVQHETLSRHHGAARVKSVTLDGSGDVAALVLDSEVPIFNEPDLHNVADMRAVADMRKVGVKSGAAVRRTDGSIRVHALSGATGASATIALAAPVADDTTAGGPFDAATIPLIEAGCLVVVGAVGSEYRRLVVSEIQPGKDLTATLTLVDEAPELWVV